MKALYISVINQRTKLIERKQDGSSKKQAHDLSVLISLMGYLAPASL